MTKLQIEKNKKIAVLLTNKLLYYKIIKEDKWQDVAQLLWVILGDE